MALTTLLTTLASKATPRSGFGGASTVWPALSSSRITPANPDASAKAPWTRTTVGPGMGSPRGCRGGPHDATSPDPSGPAQGGTAPDVGSTRHGAVRGRWLLPRGTPLTPQDRRAHSGPRTCARTAGR